jgi:hypothetical protein
MKIAIAALLVGSAAAFAPMAPVTRSTSLNAYQGEPAKSAEEDLQLTREVILNYIGQESSEEESSEEKKEE